MKPIPRAAAPMPTDPVVVMELHHAGKLEQTCSICGRWEAATWSCSWCLASSGPAQWYRNGDLKQRHERMPTTAPADPPIEYVGSERDWPATWGPYPRQKPARDPGTPLKRVSRRKAESVAT
jgi:hypothetical protein